MWTAFIWGFGVSCGAAFGLMLFVAFLWICEGVTGKAEQKAKVLGINELSLKALTERNELSEKMLEHMAMIAMAARKYEESR